jgi:hypothetical protein
MPSADFCRSISTPFDVGSYIADRQISPGNAQTPSHLYLSRLRPMLSVSVWDFRVLCLLIQHGRHIRAGCSSGQCFACSFLQMPPRGRHPCRSASSSPDRVCKGLAPSSVCALPGAQKIPKPKGFRDTAPRTACKYEAYDQVQIESEIPLHLSVFLISLCSQNHAMFTGREHGWFW